MVWEQDVRTIVMLTNLIEETKVKNILNLTIISDKVNVSTSKTK